MCTCPVFNMTWGMVPLVELISRLSSDVSIWSQVTYSDGYESSALYLQYRSFNHPRSLECKGSVHRQKLGLRLTWPSGRFRFFTGSNNDGGRPRPRKVGAR